METAIKRGCENCGNLYCAQSPVAIWWDECVKSDFQKHWQPRLTETHVERAKHCIGLDFASPYTRHNKKFYRPYRNYYCTSLDDRIWTELEFYGCAKHNTPEDNLCDYRLTRKGLDWLGKVLGITIYDYDYPGGKQYDRERKTQTAGKSPKSAV